MSETSRARTPERPRQVRSERWLLRSSARPVGFWEFTPFSRDARVTILGITLVLFAIEAALRLADLLPNGARGFAMPLLATALVAVTLWHPPSGAIGLMLLGFGGVAIGQGGRFLSGMVLTAGLIVFACGLKMVAAFLAATLVWVAIVTAWPPGLGDWGTLGHLLALVLSVAVGAAIRGMVRRNRELSREIAAGDERLQAELRAERVRIADELHDIIAHDISVVTMHARVLERTQDPEVRQRSQQAIAHAAGQALADTRRVLQLIHREPDPVTTEPADLRATLERLAEQLRSAGDEVDLAVDAVPALARSIETTLVHAARESVTNVIKHTVGPGRQVRISLAADRDTVTLCVQNAGQAKAPVASSGYGLARLRERAELLGGTFTGGFESGSWVVRMSLPQH
ncbi:sensor histidine kinase [Microbacterium stercoris]|uniref:histidine kinase n=1 Tax=Microbacterium stercoris TaxID=2820289 RepID=A0A939QLH6_9MICO|nr:histidine kinase [Microbacterium stercoris]MBO3662965.1 two-component sensor histidine kinase [Microbacterium stercoris]